MTGYHYVADIDPPASCLNLPSAGITGMHQSIQPHSNILSSKVDCKIKALNYGVLERKQKYIKNL
jgi:hypothetical protein